MAKIGICSYVSAYNCGALLQQVALRITLEKLGHEAYFINYNPPYRKEKYSFESSRHDWHLDKDEMRKIYNHKVACYDSFFKKYINPYVKETSEEFDTIIYGSDQIWRHNCYPLTEYDKVFFGINEFKAKKHISYGASAGNVEENVLPWLNEFKVLVTKKLDAIGVREISLKEILDEENIKSSIVCDPVFLLSADEWREMFRNITMEVPKTYFLDFTVFERRNFQKSEMFASSVNVPIIKVSSHPRCYGDCECYGPLETLYLIDNSTYTITNSFHGTSFSLIFNKNVLIDTRNLNDRIKGLFITFGMKNPNAYVFDNLLMSGGIPKTDFNKLNENIEKIREISINWLKNNI